MFHHNESIRNCDKRNGNARNETNKATPYFRRQKHEECVRHSIKCNAKRKKQSLFIYESFLCVFMVTLMYYNIHRKYNMCALYAQLAQHKV